MLLSKRDLCTSILFHAIMRVCIWIPCHGLYVLQFHVLSFSPIGSSFLHSAFSASWLCPKVADKHSITVCFLCGHMAGKKLRSIDNAATIRYCTRCYFNVRSKAARKQQLKGVEQKNEKVKTDMLRSNSKSLGNPCSHSWRRKWKAAVGRICRKGRF